MAQELTEETLNELTKGILEDTKTGDEQSEGPHDNVVTWETEKWEISSRFSDLLVQMTPIGE
jgi:hypothetical protein